jgi:hypothetical protein
MLRHATQICSRLPDYGLLKPQKLQRNVQHP